MAEFATAYLFVTNGTIFDIWPEDTLDDALEVAAEWHLRKLWRDERFGDMAPPRFDRVVVTRNDKGRWHRHA